MLCYCYIIAVTDFIYDIMLHFFVIITHIQYHQCYIFIQCLNS